MIRALGGGELIGDKLVRLAYLDESGTGDPQKEPHVVVAGVIVDADKQLARVQRHLRGMVERHVPKEHRHGFVFHAKELFNGGKVFKRGEDDAHRLEVLKEICSIPKQFSLPVVGSYNTRALTQSQLSQESLKPKDILRICIGVAAFTSIVQVEAFMRDNGHEDELAWLCLENNELSKQLIKFALRLIRTEDRMPHFPLLEHFLPLERIMSEISFQEKADSSLLQIADACAYTIRKKLSRDPVADEYFDLIKGQLTESSRRLSGLE